VAFLRSTVALEFLSSIEKKPLACCYLTLVLFVGEDEILDFGITLDPERLPLDDDLALDLVWETTSRYI
jgi:hypothetical protein